MTGLPLATRQEASGLAKMLRRQRPSRALCDQVATFLDGLADEKRAPASRLDADELRLLGMGAWVRRALVRHEDPRLKMIAVAAVVRDLEPTLGRAGAHMALLTLADEGEIEFSPSAGTELHSQADLDVCPLGPRGTRLVYARLLALNIKGTGGKP